MAHLTPFNDQYETCERAEVSLRIYHDTMRHEAITEILGLAPTDAATKGEEYTTPAYKKKVAKVTRWILSSGKEVESLDVRRHLDWLLDRLAGRQEAIESLHAASARMSVTCIWWSRSGHGGPTLWPPQMRRLAELNLECSFDIYFFGPTF
jgi:hypothetical protein